MITYITVGSRIVHTKLLPLRPSQNASVRAAMMLPRTELPGQTEPPIQPTGSVSFHNNSVVTTVKSSLPRYAAL